MDLSLDELRAIIESRDFERLVGTVENAYFDCKRQPYGVDNNEAQKRELAKDVSAFANAGGGFIFIGFRTEKNTTHSGDEVTAIRPFDQSLIDHSRYEQIIAAWIYPMVERLSIAWFDMSDAKGIAVITIPPQRERTKPFLIKKTIDGTKTVETVFGYAERRGDVTDIRSVIDLQRALQAGFSYHEEIAVRLDSLAALVERRCPDRIALAETETMDTRARKRIEEALQHEE